jgi:hypothetical protein
VSCHAFRSEFGHAGCAVNDVSVAQLADFLRFSKALDLRYVLEQCGHWSSEVVSQNHRHVAAELLAALNVYCAFMLSRQMFMAGLATIPHRTDSSGSAQAERDTAMQTVFIALAALVRSGKLPLGVIGVYMAGESSRPIARGGRPSDIERRRWGTVDGR